MKPPDAIPAIRSLLFACNLPCLILTLASHIDAALMYTISAILIRFR